MCNDVSVRHLLQISITDSKLRNITLVYATFILTSIGEHLAMGHTVIGWHNSMQQIIVHQIVYPILASFNGVSENMY
jgi:hypothetical protein